jgi:hypothetical protein
LIAAEINNNFACLVGQYPENPQNSNPSKFPVFFIFARRVLTVLWRDCGMTAAGAAGTNDFYINR